METKELMAKYPDEPVVLGRGNTCLSCGSVQRDAFKEGVEWAREHPSLDTKVTFGCINQKVTMTIGELIKYYIDQECADVADECGL